MKQTLKRLSLLIIPLISGCTIYHHGYPLSSECKQQGMYYIGVRIASPSEISALYSRTDGMRKPDSVGAFQGWNVDGHPVLVLPPLRGQRDKIRMEDWGHELAHVVCGQFHKGSE